MSFTNGKKKTAMRRLVAPAAVAALSIGLLPGVAGAVARDTASACAGAPEDGFTDTGPEGTEQESAVDCLNDYDVTKGTTETTFSPGRTVDRGQMALFIYRKLQRVDDLVLPEPAAVDDAFDDVDAPQEFEDAINVLAAIDVIDGFTDGTFRAGLPVTRAQATKFIAREMTHIGVTLPPTPEDAFTDDETDVHELTINQLAELGIVQGRSEGIYDPGRALTRGQMAIILTRNLAELVDRGAIDIQAPTVVSDDADDGALAFTLTFDEPVAEASAENVGNYTVSNADTAVGVVTAVRGDDDPNTVLVTVADPLDCSAGAVTLDQTVEDLVGNAGTQTGYELVADCTPDTTPPLVTGDDAENEATSFTVSFDEPVDPDSAALVTNYTVSNGETEVAVVTATPDADEDEATNDVLLDLGDGALDCSAGAVSLDQTVEDLAGNAGTQTGYQLVADCTPADTTPPTVTDDDAEDEGTSFTVSFDEPVDPDSAAEITNYTVSNGETEVAVVTATPDADEDEATNDVLLVLDDGEALDCSVGSVTLDQTVDDLVGNAATQTGYVLVANCAG